MALLIVLALVLIAKCPCWAPSHMWQQREDLLCFLHCRLEGCEVGKERLHLKGCHHSYFLFAEEIAFTVLLII